MGQDESGAIKISPAKFIETWKDTPGKERGTAQSFLNDLCLLLDVPQPKDHRSEGRVYDDYCFERPVKFKYEDGSTSGGSIDLYRKGCFVLEAKQSQKRQKGGDTYEQLSFMLEGELATKVRPAAKAKPAAWDVLMRSAKRQAEDYAKALDEWPPFIIVVDVGRVIEVYADFSQQGKNYAQFPNRNRFRITMDDLHDDDVRATLRAVWLDPMSLDPSAKAAEVTQGIAMLLARMTASLESRAKLEDPTLKAEHAYKVSKFLMRCIFAMFAEDMELLPSGGFLRLIQMYRGKADRFHLAANDFFEKMDKGGHVVAIQADIARFNGGLFRDAITVQITEDELALLEQAAIRDWRNVEPAIFGTLLEQALSERDRSRLGAHYTPRAYVERLVVPTIIEPLRDDWEAVQSEAIGKLLEGEEVSARTVVKKFHDKLCNTLVLDPACGTGNFLYVSLELMKKLEGEVLDFLVELGEESEPLATVDPHQFLGIEKNPRAVPIAELVLWIGYLQWWFRTRSRTLMQEPILRDFNTIRAGDAVLEFEREELLKDEAGRPITRQDPSATKLHPITGETIPDPDARLEVYRYVAPRAAAWPAVDFIVGNPPFIGGKDLRAELGDGYTEALWKSRGKTTDSIDFVMYWWDEAAKRLRQRGTRLRRFGFITTNSITQKFSRRVMEKHLKAGKDAISLVFAVPDHPWVKSSRHAGRKAAVRIAMTVAEKGRREGKLSEVVREDGLDTDQPLVELRTARGTIAPDLTTGVDVTTATALLSNAGMASPGVKLHGDGFIVTAQEAAGLGLGSTPGLEQHIRPYRNGRDLTAKPRMVKVIDLFGLTEDEVRQKFPRVYQRVLERVKPERDVNNRASYRDNWWIFGEPRRELRPALEGLNRYIVTVETTKHRVFQFLPAEVLADNMLVCVASSDPYVLGVLSSTFHGSWALRAGGWLGVGNDPRYSKSRCFDPFPFPLATEDQRKAIAAVADELDSLRKRVIAERPFLTMTGLYNVRDKLIRGEALDEEDKIIHAEGAVSVIHKLHLDLDRLVTEAYGWPADLSDEDILSRIVALNAERQEEEKHGLIRWLRPDYQERRFAPSARQVGKQLDADLDTIDNALPSLPKDDTALISELRQTLRLARRPMDTKDIAKRFKEGGRSSKRVERGLQLLAAAGVARKAPQGWFVLGP